MPPSLQIRNLSILLTPAMKTPTNSSVFHPIPIPHRTLQQPTGQDLDHINTTHTHLLHSNWPKLTKLSPNFTPFTVKHILLKTQSNHSISLQFFKWVDSNHPNLLTLETISIMVHILTKNRKFLSAEDVLSKIVVKCDVGMHGKVFDSILYSYRMCDSTPRVFDALFKMYAGMKRFRNATETFCRMREYGFVPTIESCNLFMSSLLSFKRAGVVVAFYYELRRLREKVSVNVFSVNMLVNAYCQLGELESARRVFDEMPEMGFKRVVSTYNTLISAYVDGGLLVSGVKLKDTMERDGIRPNVITYNAIIHGFCKEGKLRDAYKVFNEMKAMDVAPDTVTYNVMISGFCKSGKTDMGNEIFEEMLRNGVKADILTYNALLLGLCNVGKTRKAAYLVQELDKKKLRPNASTFAALIRGQCARKNPERAFELYKSMIKSGCRPNMDTINIMMSAFVKNNDFDGALCLIKEMLERPAGPDSVIFSELCKEFSQIWKDRLVMCLSKEVDDGRLALERIEKVKGIIYRSDAITSRDLQGVCRSFLRKNL